MTSASRQSGRYLSVRRKHQSVATRDGVFNLGVVVLCAMLMLTQTGGWWWWGGAYYLRSSPGCCGDTCTAALCLCKLQQRPCRSQRQHVTSGVRGAATRATKWVSRSVPLVSYSMLTNLHSATNGGGWLMADCTCWGCSTWWSGSHPRPHPPQSPVTVLLGLILLVQFFYRVALLILLFHSLFSALQLLFLPSELI